MTKKVWSPQGLAIEFAVHFGDQIFFQSPQGTLIEIFWLPQGLVIKKTW